MKYNLLKTFLSASTKSILTYTRATLSKVSYIQGQSPHKNIREYFYYIDHQGMVNTFIKLILNQIFKETNVLTVLFVAIFR